MLLQLEGQSWSLARGGRARPAAVRSHLPGVRCLLRDGHRSRFSWRPVGGKLGILGTLALPPAVLGSLPGHVSTEDISSGDEEGAESPQPPGGPEEAGGVWRAAWAGGVETGARADAAGGATGNQGSGVWAARPQRRSHRRGRGVMSPLVPGPSALSQPAAAARGAGQDRLSGAGGGADRGNEPPAPPAPRCPRPAVSSQVSFPPPVFNLTPGVSLPPWASRGVPVWGGGRLCTRRCSKGITCAINACRHRHRPARRVPLWSPFYETRGGGREVKALSSASHGAGFVWHGAASRMAVPRLL